MYMHDPMELNKNKLPSTHLNVVIFINEVYTKCS